MITLGIDTSFHYLTLVLFDNEHVLASIQKEAFKKQSELVLVEIEQLFLSCGLKPSALEAIVVTDGPGSYTGLRIGLTIAKVLGSLAKVKVYTLSSLQVLAGMEEDIHVLLDARAKRVYYAHYQKGSLVGEEKILPIETLSNQISPSDRIIGDGALISRETYYPEYTQHFIQLKDKWIIVEDIDALIPRYLKANEDYHP
ncbi:MAG TPA: tRNA (adenosine(37)-N6)-threonylcarbamoyltransferase complex dimerization subunit type 1 TsaB [Erysipelotrichaceae bacterium]|nr:tRNA (adenosine(37)-N6)-threonylcarbamoyltransferase complex dimerization subunit type 1 TsaB [Erysipelotrichaceae bacterium]